MKSASVLPRDTLGPLVCLAALSTGVRVLMFLAYSPAAHPDTGTYFALARQIVDLDLSGHDGGRTPIYPLVIAVAGLNPYAVYVMQMALGVLAGVLLFFTALRFQRSHFLAVLIGLTPTVVMNQLFMEANLLAEHVTGVLAVAALYVAVTILFGNRALGRTVLLGLLVAATALARPGYAALVPVYALIVLLDKDRRWMRAAAYLAAACVPIAAWIAVNAISAGQFSMSTRMGIGLMNHSGAFIEYADPRYSTIRDIYLRHRAEAVKTPEAQAHRQGEQYGTIFYALDDLKAATGLSEKELARELQKLSFDLFRRHPGLYARSVFKAWLSYWAAPNYWKVEGFRSPGVARAMTALWRIEHPLMRSANLVLVLALTLLALQAAIGCARNSWSSITEDPRLLALLLAGGSVLWFSFFQALFEYGENGRYSIPMQQIVLTFVALYMSWLLERRKLALHAMARA